MYTFRVILNWWKYIYGILIATLLANLLPWLMVNDLQESVIDMALRVPALEGSFIDRSKYIALLVLAPLLNLYAVVFLAKSATEAEDDIWRDTNALASSAPSEAYRFALIRSLQISAGLVYVPLCFWFLTCSTPWLWGENQQFWFTRGFWLVALANIATFLIIPKYFPGVARAISRIEGAVGDHFQRLM